MTDPPRFIEGNGLAGSLLRAGAEELPSRDVVRKAALAIGAGAAIASSSASAAGATTSMATGTAGSVVSKAGAPFTLAILGKWLGIGALTGFVTVTSASQVGHLQSRSVAAHAPPPKATVSTESSLVPPPSGAPRAIDVPAPPDVETGRAPPPNPFLAPVQPAPPRAKNVAPVSSDVDVDFHADAERGGANSGPSDPGPMPATASETLPQASPSRASDDPSPALAPEIAFVDRAWRAMQRGSYEGALAALVPYELRFPELRLHPEVLFLRMEAERRLGHSASAMSLARQIVSIYPKSAQAARARSMLTSR
jgi:hypothetical protein